MGYKYKTALLKLSGEALKAKDDIYEKASLEAMAKQIIKLAKDNIGIGIVIGGGNIWRGNLASKIDIPQINADFMGMMATVINALALEAIIKRMGYNQVIVYSSLDVRTVTQEYNFKQARELIKTGTIAIFAGGTGYAYVTTDTNAIIRAIEIEADVMLMAKNGVKGVFDSDPKTNPNAKFFAEMTYFDVINNNLAVMDLTTATIARDAHMPIEVFDMQGEDNIIKVFRGELESTKIR